MPQQQPIELLRFSVDQAAKALNISPTLVWQRIREGQIRAHKDGRLTFISREELHRYITAGESASHPAETPASPTVWEVGPAPRNPRAKNKPETLGRYEYGEVTNRRTGPRKGV